MSLVVLPPNAAEAELRAAAEMRARLLMQPPEAHEQEAAIAHLQQRVTMFETRFNRPSSDVDRAIDAGELAEDHEVCQWLFAYKLLLRLGDR